MRKSRGFHVTTALVALMTGAIASSARASDPPTKRECIDANAQSQVQRRDGKLRAAQTSLRLCTSSACPTAVRDDCAQRLDSLERALPSLVFEAKDAAGADLTAVRVQVDGELLAEKLDGTALAVDPGEHTFSFEVAGQSPVTKKLVLREGDRGRRERIILAAPIVAKPAPVVVAPPPPAPPPPASNPEPPPDATPMSPPPADSGSAGKGQRILGMGIGIGGLVGLGVGGVFAGLASSKWSSSQENCASVTDCKNRPSAVSDRSSALSSATVSTIAFVAGGALLATGIVVYLTAPKRDGAAATDVRFVPNVGGATVAGSFW